MASNAQIMNLTESTHAMQITPSTSHKPFPFLELPGELQNMFYEFVSDEAEAEAVMPIIKRAQAPGTRQTECKAFALLRTCKQIRAECYLYIHSAVHGTIHWSRHYGYMEARVPWGLAFKRTKEATEITRTLQDHGHMFQHIRQLELHGNGGASFILDLVDYDEGKLNGSTLSDARADQKRQFLRSLRLAMQNVERIRLFVNNMMEAENIDHN